MILTSFRTFFSFLATTPRSRVRRGRVDAPLPGRPRKFWSPGPVRVNTEPLRPLRGPLRARKGNLRPTECSLGQMECIEGLTEGPCMVTERRHRPKKGPRRPKQGLVRPVKALLVASQGFLKPNLDLQFTQVCKKALFKPV